MLEFYYDFLDEYLNRRDFELIQMDTNSIYMAISGNSINEIVKPELREEYHNGGKGKFLSTSKDHDRTPGLFKQEFQKTTIIDQIIECYCAEDDKSSAKFSCKGVSKKHNPMSWKSYLEALNESIDKA